MAGPNENSHAWGMPKGWVPMIVPTELAPRVLRDVADWIAEDSDTGPRDWADATAADKRAFFADSTRNEWRLVTELARHDKPVTSADLAEALGVEVADIAGAVGPLKKRAKRNRWVAPVRSTRFWEGPGKKSRRGLVLHDELKSWVTAGADDIAYAVRDQ